MLPHAVRSAPRVEAKPHAGANNGNGSSDDKNGHNGSNGNGASTTLAERNGANPLANTAEGRAPQGLLPDAPSPVPKVAGEIWALGFRLWGRGLLWDDCYDWGVTVWQVGTGWVMGSWPRGLLMLWTWAEVVLFRV